MTIENNTLSQEGFINAKQETLYRGTLSTEYLQTCRVAATEGVVMLENDGTLPLTKGVDISVFGRIQHDYFYVGYGSGGDVKKPYAISLMDGLVQSNHFNINEKLNQIYKNWSEANIPDHGGWGTWPTNLEEMPLDEALVKEASEESEVGIVVIGRSAGEDRESLLQPGSYYLTDDEINMLDLVTTHFNKVVVIIDAGNTIDLSWVKVYGNKIGAVLYAWQGGMESGNALADIMSGDVSPSGKLTSTIAQAYVDYPSANNFGGEVYNNYAEDIYVGYRYFETFAKEKVLYPFGYGLSYSSFTMDASNEINICEEFISISVTVTNIGNHPAKEVVQIYYSAPQGQLGKPSLQLATFAKTNTLNPEESQTLTLTFDKKIMASYDDSGATGNKSAWILEAGIYELYLGNSVRDVKKINSLALDTLQVIKQVTEASAVAVDHQFDRLVAKSSPSGTIEKSYERVPTRTINLKERILSELPQPITTSNETLNFDAVISGYITLDEFIGSLTIEELEGLTRGDYIMNSPLGAPGNAGVFGGTIETLRAKGVEPITTSDGPSGVRLQYEAALLPCGTALASTWNYELLVQLATFQGAELKEKGSNVLLAPGMNIMRDPLCGRNFEYFSEDPVLTGLAASAMIIGLQTHGHSACPKHYACNNQERFRSTNDSRLSERALREIYLKGFEICVKLAKPKNIMTSYNKINGVWGHYHYELCQTILRGEWGYEGNIMTDWWMKPSVDPDFPLLTNEAYRVRAGVDVLMPGGKTHFAPDGDGSLLESYNKGGITLAEIQQCAKKVLEFAMFIKNN